MQTLEILKQADIFFGFSLDQLQKIEQFSRIENIPVGEMIFEENSASDELYIIARGEVEIQVDPSLVSDQHDAIALPVTIATLRRGQSFGEVALVDQGLRSASIRSAAADTELVVISRKDLINLCEEQPHTGYILMRNLAADLALKIRNTDLRLREHLLSGKR